jgi:hypothetical protein
MVTALTDASSFSDGCAEKPSGHVYRSGFVTPKYVGSLVLPIHADASIQADTSGAV